MSFADSNQLIYLILTNELDEKNAYKIANLLLTDKLVPCVTFKNIESNFWWEGKLNKLKEVQLVIKCKKENVSKVCSKISEFHSYEIPEIIYFPVSVNNDYHHWVNSF